MSFVFPCCSWRPLTFVHTSTCIASIPVERYGPIGYVLVVPPVYQPVCGFCGRAEPVLVEAFPAKTTAEGFDGAIIGARIVPQNGKAHDLRPKLGFCSSFGAQR
jgi:hypothetical protein